MTGSDDRTVWIPAFAGMTDAGMTNGQAITIYKMEILYVSQKDWEVFIKGKLKKFDKF